MNSNTKVHIETLGCKLNQAESEQLYRSFVLVGARVASSLEDTTLCILNTCSVTQEAERKARQFLRRVRDLKPETKIYATGCYARRNPEEIKSIGGIEVIPDYNQIAVPGSCCSPDSGDAESYPSVQVLPKTRSMLKIQEGCNYRCTYCVVPAIKGKERSLPLNQIVDSINTRVKEGYKEVVLTGTRVGSYNFMGQGLKELLTSILEDTSIARVRLSSLQPQEINSELLALWGNKRLCPHFHIAMQSGSDKILDRMGRRYSTSEYIKAIGNLKAQVPDATVTTDIIAGFPEEGDKEFDQTYSLCQEAGFMKIHVFPFSPRPGTPAASQRGQVEKGVKKERTQQMLELSRYLYCQHLESCANRILNVLWEKEADRGLWSGLAESYIRVYCYCNSNLRNKISSVRIGGLFRDGLLGETVS